MVLVGFYQSSGRGRTEDAARQKSGTVFDPEVVHAFLAASRKSEFWTELGAEDLWNTVLALSQRRLPIS